MNIQKYIKSNTFGFYLTLGTIITQSIHTQYILTKLSSLGSFAGFHSFAISILISGSVLYFTVKGKTKIAIGAACLEAYFNICYYVLYIDNSNMSWGYLFIAIPSSLALPTVLALFSHEVVEDEKKEMLSDSDKLMMDIYNEAQDKYEITLSKLKEIEEKPESLLKGKDLKLDIETNDGIRTFNAKIK